MACEGKKKARVEFAWEDSKDSFSTSYPPVTVTTTPKNNFTGGQCNCIRYRLNYSVRYGSAQLLFNSSAQLWGPITNVDIIRTSATTNNSTLIADCRGNAQTFSTCQPAQRVNIFTTTNMKLVSLSVARIDSQADTCGNPVKRCLFEIFDSRGKVFTQEKPGDCPTYQIICDDDCPPDNLKCHSGCCVDCGSVSSRIEALTNLVNSINRK